MYIKISSRFDRFGEKEMKQTTNNRMDTLEVIRCFAFIGIFAFHTHINLFRTLGRWGVDVFFVLNGFLMMVNYYKKNKIVSYTVKDSFVFCCTKIKKLYPLYVACTLFTFPIHIFGNTTVPAGNAIIRLIYNMLLIQEWLPIPERSMVGVAWFLCTISFFYFIFPWVLRYFEKNYTDSKAYFMIFILIMIMLILGLCGRNMNDVLGAWIVYYWPLARIWEILIGCNLAYIYLRKSHLGDSRKYTLFELVGIVLALFSNIFAMINTPKNGIDYFVTINVEDRWWTYSFIYIFSTCILIYSFSIGKGFFSQWLVSKHILCIAKLSSYAFLISNICLQCLDIIYNHLPYCGGKRFSFVYGRWISLTIGFFLTMVASFLWTVINDKISKLCVKKKLRIQ